MKKEKPTHSTDASSSQKYTIPIVTEKEARIRIIKDFLIFMLPILLLLVIFRFFFMIGPLRKHVPAHDYGFCHHRKPHCL